MNDIENPIPHIPVLLDEVIEGLAPAPGNLLIDGTLGAAGHSKAWLNATAPDGRVLGFDRDSAAVAEARVNLAPFGDRALIAHESYAGMGLTAPDLGFGAVDGILLDLGYSSMQIDSTERGFSFRYNAPLDMRFDMRQHTTAADLLNTLPEDEIARLIFEYGEDRHARRIARAVTAARPITSTGQLADIIVNATPRSKEKIHPATRTFQALRIAVNDELGELERVLPQAVGLLKPGGRLTVISFHSLEDRIVKQFMKNEATDCICPPRQPVCTCTHRARLKLVTRKPIVAGSAEIAHNPRSRSAKLRIAERL